MTKTAIIIAFLALSTTAAHAASFACEKAAAPDEKAICTDRGLDNADVKMTTMFDMEVQLVAMGERDTLRATQKNWLAKRTECQADLACLRASYEQRLGELQAIFKDVISRAPQ